MMTEPFVTFVIPTVGRETLERTLYSLTQQVDGDWEALVVGDGVDPADQITDIRMTAIALPRARHEALMRNWGVSQARGRWVAFLDDDDTASPNYVQWLREEEEATGAEVVIFRQTISLEQQVYGDAVIPSRPEIVWGNVGIAYAVRTPIAQQIKFKRSKHEDLLHLCQLEMTDARIHFSNHIAYFGRDHRG